MPNGSFPSTLREAPNDNKLITARNRLIPENTEFEIPASAAIRAGGYEVAEILATTAFCA